MKVLYQIMAFMAMVACSTAVGQTRQDAGRAGMKAVFEKKMPVLSKAADMVSKASIPTLQKPKVAELHLEEQMQKIKSQCPLLLAERPTLELKGERKDNSMVQLEWETTNGWNNRDFILERSFGDTLHFAAVTYVPATELAGMRDKYEQPDGNGFNKISYYRVKLNLRSGEVVFSNIAKVKGFDKEWLALYPNPVLHKMQLNLLADMQGKMAVTVFDAAGRQVGAVNQFTMVPGPNYQEIQVDGLPGGFYILKITMPDKTERSARFIKL